MQASGPTACAWPDPPGPPRQPGLPEARPHRVFRAGGAAEGTRTPDPIITNDVLYQLSYSGPGAMPVLRNPANGRHSPAHPADTRTGVRLIAKTCACKPVGETWRAIPQPVRRKIMIGNRRPYGFFTNASEFLPGFRAIPPIPSGQTGRSHARAETGIVFGCAGSR